MTLEEFLKKYGGVYEHSPWIAEAAYNLEEVRGADPLSVSALHNAMIGMLGEAGYEQKLALIKAHPDLGVAAADLDRLTESSQSEQAGAGLKECTPQEFAEFQQLNADYKEKFGFPFIIAVKGLTRHDILESFRARINNSTEDEFATALEQINKIALLRLTALSES